MVNDITITGGKENEAKSVTFDNETWKVFTEEYCTDFDGRGYTLTFNNANTATAGSWSGFVGTLKNATWENLNIVINHTIPEGATCYNLFAGVVSNFTMKNCNVSVTLTNNSDASTFSLFRPTAETVMENCVFNLVSNTSGTAIVVGDTVTGYTASGTFKDCVFINENVTSFGNVAEDVTVQNVYHYASVADFYNNTNGKVQNGTTVTDVTTVTIVWGEMWQISATDIKIVLVTANA